MTAPSPRARSIEDKLALDRFVESAARNLVATLIERFDGVELDEKVQCRCPLQSHGGPDRHPSAVFFKTTNTFTCSKCLPGQSLTVKQCYDELGMPWPSNSSTARTPIPARRTSTKPSTTFTPWEPSTGPGTVFERPYRDAHGVDWGLPKTEYRIRWADGRLCLDKARFERTNEEGEREKTFLVARNGKLGLGGISMKDAPPFGSEKARFFDLDRPVLVVEGEDCVIAAESLGHQALGLLGCNHKPCDEVLLPLFRDRDVVLVPDNDGPGFKCMKRHGERIRKDASSVSLLELPGLGNGGDLKDWIELQETKGLDAREIPVKFNELVNNAVAVDGTTEPEPEQGRKLELISLATIKPERVEYVVDGRVVRGDLNLIVGAPGVGKGTICMDWIARLTCGTLPGDLYGTPSSIIIASAEDSLSHTIVPRLLAAGADRNLVQGVKVTKDGDEDGLTLPDDVLALASKVKEVDAALVLVDPITAHLAGSVDSHKDASIRRALAPLARMAHETGAAVLVVAHLNKASGSDWVRRVGGSVGLTAAARNVLLVADDPDGDDRVIVHCKSNTGAYAPSLRYRIEGREIEIDGQTLSTCGVAWLGEAEGVTAADVLAETEPTERTERDEAVEWLVGYLEDQGGEANAGECIRAAEKDGIAKRTLQRARRKAKITLKKNGSFSWIWKLPEGATQTRHLAPGTLAPSNKDGASEDIEGDRYLQGAKAPRCQGQGEVAPSLERGFI